MFEEDQGEGDEDEVGSRGSGQFDGRDDAQDDDQTSGQDDGQPADPIEASFESSPHEPDPPEFDVTSGEDLVDRLPDATEVSTDVHKSFWAMVILLKIALLALSLGAMLAYFRGQLAIAAGLGVLGIVAAVRLLLRIRAFDEE